MSRIGVDITSVARLQHKGERQERLVTRLFTSREIHDAGNNRQRWPRLASRFAAKEALIKASGGLRGSRYQDIEVRRVSGAAPEVRVQGPLGQWIQAHHFQITLSVSHEEAYAVAMVLLTPREGM